MGVTMPDQFFGCHWSKAHLKPSIITVEVISRGAAKWSSELEVADVKRVHILDVATPSCDTCPWFTPDDEMLDPKLRSNL